MAVSAAEIAIAIRARDEATKALASVKTALAALGTQAQTTTRAVAANGAQMAAAARQIETVRASADSGGLSFGKLSGAVALGTVAANAFMGALGAIGGAASSAISGTLAFSSSLEQTQVGFTQLLGSGEKAAAFMQQLRDFAVATPFDFPQLADAAKRLLAMGFAAENVIPLMTDVGNAVSAIGGGTPELNRVILALGQIQAKGKVSAEEMNQLAELGISGWKMLAATTGKTTTELMKMAEAGQISSDVFLDAFHKFSAANFAGMMEAQSRTMAGALSNIRDGFGNLMATGLEPFYNALRDGAVIIADALGSPAVKQLAADLKATFQDIVTALAPVGNAFRQAFESLKAGDVMGFVGGLVDTVRSFAQGMFGAGYTLVETFASGISSAIGAAISAVADLVASIAAFLVGQSPPPEGPLSEIDAAGARLIETYVGGMASADLAPLAEVTERIGTAFDGAFRPDLLASAQQAFRDAAGDLAAMKDNAADVEGALKAIELASRDVERALADARDQIADIKDRYDEQLDSLKAQLDAINEVNDALQEQQDIQERIADLELDKQISQAKGDPTARADIRNKQDEIRFQKEEIQQRIRQLQLDGGKKQNQKEIERLQSQLLDLDRKELDLKRQEASLTDRAKLAELQKQKDINKAREDEQRIVREQARLQKELAALPIKQRIKEVEAARKAELKPLEDQVKILDRQKRLLQEQRQEYQDLKKDIQEAVKALEPKKSGGGGGGGASIPKPSGAVLPKLDIDMTKAAETAGRSLVGGIQKWIADNGPKLLGGAIGAAVGGIAFGPIGAVIGAALGSEIGQKLQQAIPDLGERLQTAFGNVEAWWEGTGRPAFEAITEWLSTEFAPRVGGLAGTAWEGFKAATAAVATWWSGDGQRGFETIVTWLGTNLARAVEWWRTTGWPEFQKAMQAVTTWWNGEGRATFGTIASMLEGAFKASMTWWHGTGWPQFEAGIRAVAKAWDEAGLPKFQSMQNILGSIKDGVLAAYVGEGGLWAQFRQGVNDVKDAVDLASKAMDALGQHINTVNQPGYLPSFFQALTTARPDLAAVVLGLQGMQKVFEYLEANGQSVADVVKNALLRAFQELLGPVGKLVGLLQEVISLLAKIKREQSDINTNVSGERALGGPVQAGKSYLVGERGPELFRPLYNGFIVPNNRLSAAGGGAAAGGGMVVNVYVSGSVTTERDLAAKVRDEILRVGRRNGSALGSLA